MRRLGVFLAVLATALVSPAAASAADLIANVGPGFSINLVKPDGSRVTHLDPGTYTIEVHDRAGDHNFHLTGPGVDRATSVDDAETVTWTVTLVDGTYRYVCDPHSDTMRGSFTVGNVPPPPPAPTRLTGTVGPSATISLRTAAGGRVTMLAAGSYVITVRDRSRAHNFRLTGPGVSRATGVRFRGTVTWRVTLRAGTYSFRCDPHRRKMRGSFMVH